MKRADLLWLVAGAWLLIGSTGPLSLAQPPRGRPGMDSGPPGSGPPVDARFRDPTQPSPEMRQAIEAAQTVPNPGPGPAAPAAPLMPQIKLKARLLGTTAPPVAMLDVNGQLYTVHKGNEMTVPGAAGGSTTLVIRELTPTGVSIEILPLKKMLMLQ